MVDVHRSYLDCAPLCRGNPRRPFDGVIDRVAFEQEVTAQYLSRLSVRAVDDDGLPLANADGGGVARRAELVSGGHHASCARLLGERLVAVDDPGALLIRERAPLLL